MIDDYNVVHMTYFGDNYNIVQDEESEQAVAEEPREPRSEFSA